MNLLASLAARAPAPVFALVGDGGGMHARRLLADPRLHLTASPRQATVLIVLGTLPEALHEAARHVHDQVSHPRATLVLDADGQPKAPFASVEVVQNPASLAELVVRMHRALTSGARRSESCFGPQHNPVQWKGIGPHGQGGKGMMGGKPYGRAMAMTGPDIRDGLQLDRVNLPLGPFLRWLPPGLHFDLVLQGDVVQDARVAVAPLVHRDAHEVFQRALREEVTIAELEIERARHHLFATAELLRLHGLDAQAVRVARLAVDLRIQDEDAVRRLIRQLRWTGALRLGTRGVGVLDSEAATAWAGPVARAAGIERDARAVDPAYRSLGFCPVTQKGGDAEARWRQRLAEAAQSIALARHAGKRLRSPGPPLEGPRGVTDTGPTPNLRDLVEQLVVGQAFDAFATAIVSLDLDASMLAPRPESEEHDNHEGEADTADGNGHGGHGGSGA